MKKILLFIPLLVGMLVSCSYDDDDLWNKVNSLDERVTSIENTLSTMNASISQMNTIVSKLEAKVSIDSVVAVAEGCQIYYSDGTSIVLKNGSDGADGKTPYIGSNGDWWIGTTDTGVKAKGSDGKNGTDGKNGSDGLTPYIGSNGNWWIGTTDTGVSAGGSSASATNVPIIGIEEYQGTYYWTQTLNGKKTWLTDSKGNKLPVSGYKPLLRTSADGYWMISYDGGVNYEYVTDEQGNHVSATNCNCTQFFQSVSYYDGVLTLVLVDGTVIRINVDHDTRMDSVVPYAIQDSLIRHDFPIYDGTNPPNVEGAYLVSPFVCVYCQDYPAYGGYAPGKVIAPYVIRFSNQNDSDNTLDFSEYNNNSKANHHDGTGCLISGSENNFTAYLVAEGETDNIKNKMSLVISGTKTAKGIENLQYALIMLEKGDDPKKVLMDVGVFRMFKDQDGLSVNTTWSPNGAKKATQGSSLSIVSANANW